MRKFFKHIGVLFALLSIITIISFGDTSNSSVPQIKHINSKFILKGQASIDPRAVEKIDIMGDELFVKTGVSVYIYAVNQYSDKKFSDTKSKIEFIKSFESNITNSLKPPYALITLSMEDKHVNLITSNDLFKAVDRDDILSGYIIPLLASHDKNTPQAKISASLLNGYSEVVSSIAKYKGVEVKSVISGVGRTISNIWKIFIYLIVFSGLGAYFYAVWKDKRKHR